MTVRVSTLGNSLRVVTDDMPHLETASIGVWVGVGARHEAPEVNGVSHMLEHMAFKGTERRTARQIAEQIEAVGGYLNAYTSREQTAYFARVMKEDVPLAVDILADILQHSVFDETELARERDVVIQEIGQINDTPDDIIFDHVQGVAFPGQAMGRSILGTPEIVRGFRRDVLAGYMFDHYRGATLVLAAAGRVDHDDVVDLAERAFGSLPMGAEADREPASYAGGAELEERPLEQVHFVLAFEGVSFTDADYYAVQVLSTVLGGGMSSRLFQEVRERRGLAYSVYSFASSYLDGGLFGVYAGTGETEIEELVPVMCDEIAKIGGAAGEEEVTRAQAQIKAGILMSLESSSSRCEQIGRQMLIYGRPLPVAEVIAEIERVDPETVSRVARRLAAAAAPSVAAIGPITRLESYDHIAARFA